MTHEGKAVQKNTSISADDMCCPFLFGCVESGHSADSFPHSRSHQSGQQKTVMHRFPAFFPKMQQ